MDLLRHGVYRLLFSGEAASIRERAAAGGPSWLQSPVSSRLEEQQACGDADVQAFDAPAEGDRDDGIGVLKHFLRQSRPLVAEQQGHRTSPVGIGVGSRAVGRRTDNRDTTGAQPSDDVLEREAAKR